MISVVISRMNSTLMGLFNGFLTLFLEILLKHMQKIRKFI